MQIEGLWGDKFTPVTSAFGFLRAPLDHVRDACEVWLKGDSGSVDVEELAGPLDRHLPKLEPLVFGVPPRLLLCATGDPNWTVIFDCSATGSEPIAHVPSLSEKLAVDAALVVTIPEVSEGSSFRLRMGVRRFALYRPDQPDELSRVRSVSVRQDGDLWWFDAGGYVQEFEQTENYDDEEITKRLTDTMLRDYARSLGLRPFEEDFYPGPCVLLSRTVAKVSGTPALSIEQAQRMYGTVREGTARRDHQADGWMTT